MNAETRSIPSRLFSSYGPIIFILVVAAALRLNNIAQPFIDDNAWREASVAMMAENFYRKSCNIFYPEVNWVGPGPGYQGREFQTISFVSALLYSALGQQDWVGRCVAVAFGLCGIFALYKLVRRVRDEQRAIAAAAIMALMPGVIRIERSFLPDPAMVALVVTSFWLFVAYLQTDQRRYLIIAAVTGTLGNLTKIPGMIIGLPMGYAALYILSSRRMLHPRKIALLAVVGALSALPVVAYYLWARHLALSYPPHHFAGEGNWLWDQGLKQWVDQKYFITRLWGPLTRIWGLPAILLLCLGLLLPVFKKKYVEAPPQRVAKSDCEKLPYLFHWWIAAGVIYYLIGALELIENPSNFHILSPAVAALSADAIMVLATILATQVKRPSLRIAIVAVLIVGLGLWGMRRSRLHSSYAAQSYELGLALRSVSRNDDLVVTLGDIIGCPVAIYYSGRRGWLFPPFEQIKDWDRLPEDNEAIEIFERLRAEGANWFGVVRKQRDVIWNARPGFAQHIERTCELAQTNERLTVYRVLSVERARAE